MRDVKNKSTQSNVTITDSSKTVNKKVNKKTSIAVTIGTVAIVAVAVFLFINANQKIERQILGTWHNDELTNLYVVFSKDDTFTINTDFITYDGTYIFVDDNRIRLDIEIVPFELVVYADVAIQNNTLSVSNIEVVGEQLSITDKIVFQRIK